MSTPELRAYISTELSRGVSKEDLLAHLSNAGWSEADIHEAMTESDHLSSPSVPSARSAAGKLKLYNPSHYTAIGFFFSLIPVFIMSVSNSKKLPQQNGAKRAVMTGIILTIALAVISLGLYAWAAHATIAALNRAVEGNDLQLLSNIVRQDFSLVKSQLLQRDESLRFAVAVREQWSTVTFVLNLIILIFVARATNKHELPAYKALKQAGEIETKSPVIPIIIGLLITLFALFVLPGLVQKAVIALM